jgi:hypothetical protein
METTQVALLLFLAAPVRADSQDVFLSSWQLAFDGDERAGFVGEAYGSLQVKGIKTRPKDPDQLPNQLNVSGNNRLYLVSDWAWCTRWRDVAYKPLHLLDQSLEFTIDLSKVGCGCVRY